MGMFDLRPLAGVPDLWPKEQKTSMLGYPIRNPYPSEASYFQKNPHVAGMAAEDNRIVMNPGSSLSDMEKQSVMKNEAIRLYLRDKKYNLDFDLTPQQKKAFANTEYGQDEHALKSTILARALSGDPSAGALSPKQMMWVQRLRKELGE